MYVPRHIILGVQNMKWTRGQVYVTKTGRGAATLPLLAGTGAGIIGGRALFRNIDLQYVRNSVARLSERTYASGFASRT